MAIKLLFLLPEAVLLILFLIAAPVLNLGNIAGICISTLLILITLRNDVFCRVLGKVWSHIWGKAAVILICLMLAAGICFATFCTVKMLGAMDSPPDEKPSAVVILGCQVKGERPSRMLRQRLDAALEYLRSEPDVPVIVSGGKGPDEGISEALCMKNYLVENGISEDRILMEDKSTNTDENLEFSFAILDEKELSRNIVLVTNNYHQYRAQLIAESHGVEKVWSVSAKTEFRFLPTYWVREWFGIAQQIFL